MAVKPVFEPDPKSQVRLAVRSRLEQDLRYLVGVKRQINARIGVHESVALDVMAELLKMSRSGLATVLIENAIVDAGAEMGLNIYSPEFLEQFKERLNKESVLGQEEDEE